MEHIDTALYYPKVGVKFDTWKYSSQ